MYTSLEFNLFLAVIIGAAIGLERESSQQGISSAGGIRTYSLISLLGALCGVFFINNLIWVSIIIAGVFSTLLVVNYTLGSFLSKELGLTSEISIIYTFILGLMTTLNVVGMQVVVAIFVVLVLILSLKSKTKKIVAGINRQEIQSFISYAIIALVVLPFLPNVSYRIDNLQFLSSIFASLNINIGQFGSLELINPRKIWLIVVLITGIDVFGYVLGKIVGNKHGYSLTSFVGGFVSSTSTTQSLAQRSKKTGVVNYLVGAAVLSNLASFLQIFVLVGPLNARWLLSITPSIIIMILTAGILATFFLKKHEKEKIAPEVNAKEGKIFSLMPALKFAGLLIVVKLCTKISLIVFGQSGFIITSVIASLAGLDAIIVTLAEMAGTVISFKFALIVFLLVNATNLISKTVYSYLQGSHKFAHKFLVSAIAIIVASFAGVLFVN
ncbi:MAG: MgtC/SapB family protein [Patescibacteria group bacterium]